MTDRNRAAVDVELVHHAQAAFGHALHELQLVGDRAAENVGTAGAQLGARERAQLTVALLPALIQIVEEIRKIEKTIKPLQNKLDKQIAKERSTTEEAAREVRVERLAVRGVAPQLLACAGVLHLVTRLPGARAPGWRASP